MPESVTFANLFAFQKIASACNNGTKSLLASVQGEIVLSINTSYSEPSAADAGRKGKKRSRDTGVEEAERAVQKVRRSGKDSGMVADASYGAATAIVAGMLKLKGPHAENVVESWAVSLRTAGQWAANTSPGGAPKLVIAMRIAAGVPLSMGRLCHALRLCRDGMVTVAVEKISGDFNLPMSDQATAAEDSGQKSMLILATVPQLESVIPPT